jgi:hypothetical protein
LPRLPQPESLDLLRIQPLRASIGRERVHETAPPGLHNATVFYLLVARVTDWKLRKIQPGGDALVHGSAFTLTDTHLYAAFQKALASESDRIETIRRYDLSKFDQIGDPM